MIAFIAHTHFFIKQFINTFSILKDTASIASCLLTLFLFHYLGQLYLILGTLFALDWYSFTNFIDERINLWMIIFHRE